MNSLIVVDCIEDGYEESDIIGVASDMKNAIRLVNEYFGDNIIIYDIIDVRDSGIEYIYKINSEDYYYKIIFRDYQLNNL